jgi:hypothetical protein
MALRQQSASSDQRSVNNFNRSRAVSNDDSTANLLSYPTVKGAELNYSPCSNYKLLSINVTDPIDSARKMQ